MSNWSAGTIGTVWIGMLCAGAVPATVNSTTERETTRLVMRHLARWGPPGTQDTQPTVGRVTGCHAGRALWRSRDDRSARQPSEVAGGRIERAYVDPSLRHGGTLPPEDRIRWGPRPYRGSIGKTPSQEAVGCRPSRISSRGRAATSFP